MTKKLIFEEIIPPKRGFAGVVKKNSYFRIIDLQGKQVADVVFFNANNIKEKNCNGISMSRQMRAGEPYKARDKLTTGDIIFSSSYRAMATITADTPVPGGIHKLVLHMCNRGLYEAFGYHDHDGCWEILSSTLSRYGIDPEDLPDSFDVFMNVEHDVAAGEWRIKEPVSRPGDYIEFRMEMDCVLALSNCPMDVIAPTNGWVCTPLKVEIYEEQSA
ncbi:MAG: hypothetical protein A2V78_14285 [Betaproteobacteria bacterium RBG_16_64_18]|nr:MAG: hypothetical protein A2V78_14285 [Betaproteobacteria bacterium RBG_16_64_18]OGA42052.1 MAG: hypothetical protein A3G26_12090 [Betaproteobacteria bacterium RIFCSPLOWO2_12_FULL_65_110]